MNILVIGGAGYIGSHTVNLLKKEGYTPVIYDNLSKGHKEAGEILGVKLINGDLGDKEKLKKVFSDEDKLPAYLFTPSRLNPRILSSSIIQLFSKINNGVLNKYSQILFIVSSLVYLMYFESILDLRSDNIFNMQFIVSNT